ncbi:uncharacterized protein N0V89_000816 [Didymosphaeria variabile]|uniref:Glycosyltransferase family 2 protein n=1 Tax=Didymosphaeria variabile TaxID=1932322 RepID=A0A9W8XVW3_9PLEO|nr:uncharacterized protein N0V89_000816 [Didymosphaeria variabile]KAJ4360256.1 hypothetical protein N0V89_000816 [Didymosphaeria variabile]
MLLGHIWLAALFLATAKIAQVSLDPFLIWFAFLLIFRHYKTVINLVFYFRYKPAVPPTKFNLKTTDVAVIVPTLGPEGNPTFAEMFCGILYNQPKYLIFSTATEDGGKRIEGLLSGFQDQLENGTSAYQVERRLPPLTKCVTEVKIVSVKVASKREQFVRALEEVSTSIIASADDTAVWQPNFLSATLPAFASEEVALVGTRKWVKRLPRPAPDASLSWLTNTWNTYWFGYWNAIAATYLIRHNFEARATNAADGGVFTVSGRTFLVRSHIVQAHVFKFAFLNEFLLGGRVGPINADDDNFLTRWVSSHGHHIKFQCSEEATINIVLGKDGGRRFISQCLRWSRTTMRQNPQVLLLDRTVWWRHPLTVWTTYFPWLYNAALIWDPLMVGTFWLTKLYQESEHRGALTAGLIGFIWATKFIKTAPWFWKYPQDFLLYFFPVPVWFLFVYGHSILKIFTAFTFWDLAWTGRELPTVTEPAKKNVMNGQAVPV